MVFTIGKLLYHTELFIILTRSRAEQNLTPFSDITIIILTKSRAEQSCIPLCGIIIGKLLYIGPPPEPIFILGSWQEYPDFDCNTLFHSIWDYKGMNLKYNIYCILSHSQNIVILYTGWYRIVQCNLMH